MGSAITDADGALAREAERVSGAQGVQDTRHSGSRDSGSITGAEAQLSAAENLDQEPLEQAQERHMRVYLMKNGNKCPQNSERGIVQIKRKKMEESEDL